MFDSVLKATVWGSVLNGVRPIRLERSREVPC